MTIPEWKYYVEELWSGVIFSRGQNLHTDTMIMMTDGRWGSLLPYG